MLKNYLKIAVKNIFRNKLYSFAAAFGLAVGFGLSLLALQYLLYELSFDNIPAKDRVYQVILDSKFGGVIQKMSNTPPHLDKKIKDYFPEIESAASFVLMDETVQQSNHLEKTYNFCIADSNIFNILGLRLIEENKQTCLLDPESVVITKKFAKACFGGRPALGRTIKIYSYQGWKDFKVSGILQEPPENSSISFDALQSSESSLTLSTRYKFTWHAMYPLCFIKLRKGVDVDKFKSRLSEFIAATGGDTSGTALELTPMKYVHFRTDIATPLLTSESKYLFILSGVALLIFAVSVFNFIGINVTLLSKRMKEIGIRKITGASLNSIMLQFLVENGALLFVSLIAGVCISELLLPLFNTMLDVNLAVNNLTENLALVILLVIIISLDFSIGLYTVHFFASLKTQSLIKGQVWNLNSKQSLRKVLIGLQFSIAAFLICCTIIVIDQLNFVSRKDLGFEKKNILLINPSSIGNKAGILKTELRRNPYILDVSEANVFPSLGLTASMSGSFDNGNKSVKLNLITVDEHFIPMLGMHLLKGRNFNPQFASDSSHVTVHAKYWAGGGGSNDFRAYAGAVIINQEALKELTSVQAVSSDSIRFVGNNWRLIGIVRDFNYSSLRNAVEPIVLQFDKSGADYLGIKIQKGKTKEVLQYVQDLWKKINPDRVLQYSFLDAEVNKLYSNEERIFTAVLSGSVIAILIALLGIFALSSFISETKTKEIAVRKVVGSSVTGVVKLLSVSFIKIIIVAGIIACPAAYLVMQSWLQNFAYRISLNILIFPVAVLLMLLLAILTIAFQSIKAATANPVESLRYE